MKTRFLFPGRPVLVLIGLFLTLSTLPAHAYFGFKLDGTLDKPAISKAYFEGDFARILPPLEAWRQGLAENKTRDDSIFVFKYLSVVYAASPATKEKSRSFMFQLLTLAPTIEILDMYASDEIEHTFHAVKQEFKERNAYLSTHDHLGKEKAPATQEPVPPATKPPEEHSSKWVWWTAGGVGLAATAIGAYFLLEPTSTAGNKHVIGK